MSQLTASSSSSVIAFAFLLTVVGACSSAVSQADVVSFGGFDAGPDASSGVACAGRYCGRGEACCLSNGTCFLQADQAVACPTPPPGDINQSCASNLDCGPDYYCAARFCLGLGRCEPRANCTGTVGGGPPPGPIAICGCDGVNYTSGQAICNAGVRIGLGTLGCGQGMDVGGADGGDAGPIAPTFIGCGGDSQCPVGATCCAILGICVPSNCADCCSMPPPNANRPCGSNLDCMRDDYCDGLGCGTRGWCIGRGTQTGCGGILSPVCGCDGVTYTNDCSAAAAGARVSRAGGCGP